MIQVVVVGPGIWTESTPAEIRNDIDRMIYALPPYGEIYPWQRDAIRLMLPMRIEHSSGPPPNKPSWKLTPLERAQQGRRARAAKRR